jgi:hypothetical protein
MRGQGVHPPLTETQYPGVCRGRVRAGPGVLEAQAVDLVTPLAAALGVEIAAHQVHGGRRTQSHVINETGELRPSLGKVKRPIMVANNIQS